MYDDVSNQERNKERLFEEEIELKWEKGGSGLVFYTDAQYWQALEGGILETLLSLVLFSKYLGLYIGFIHLTNVKHMYAKIRLSGQLLEQYTVVTKKF